MGNIDNCHIMATISGLAERDILETTGVKSMKGKTVGEIFLTKEINKAGCYPIKLVVDGVDTVVTVDDFVPFKKNKVEEDKLAFSKTTKGENEIWMILLEKAIAKVYGSYEAMENKSVEKGFNLLAGGPSVNFKMHDFKKDISRAGELKNERVDKLWEIVNKANKQGWVTTLQSPQIPEYVKRGTTEESIRFATVEGKGIRYNHCYTLLDAKPVTLENNYTDIICLLRNPWGKNSRGLQWTGDWGPECDLWNKHTKKQVGRTAIAPTQA